MKLIFWLALIVGFLAVAWRLFDYFYFSNQSYVSSEIRFEPTNVIHPILEKPPMGWNSWNNVRCGPEMNEIVMRQMIDLLVESGMRDVGYRYFNLDDCWQIGRDENGVILADPERFPSGIKALADYAHERGLKFGLYTSGGRLTCMSRPGSYRFEELDAQTYAEWGVDYIKIDWCGIEYLDTYTQYRIWRDAIDKTNRQMILSIAIANIDNQVDKQAWTWGRELVGIWRTAIDLNPFWEDVLRVMDRNSLYAEYSGRGSWNDADMLQVGNGELTLTENKTHFGMWAMMASPLIAGNDLRNMSGEIKEILTHDEIIAINQDKLGMQARLIKEEDGRQVYVKVLSTQGERAVALLNRTDEPQEISVTAEDLGLHSLIKVRNVWERSDLGIRWQTFSQAVQPHEALILRVHGRDKVNLLHYPVMINQLRSGYLLDQEPKTEEGIISFRREGNKRMIVADIFSDVRYNSAANCQVFTTEFFVDPEWADPRAEIRFKVYGDGDLLYRSDFMTIDSALKRVSININKVRVLNLQTSPANSNYNIAQIGTWLNSRVECSN